MGQSNLTPQSAGRSFGRNESQELNIPAKLTFLYVNIGRGHPFYLDGINDALIRQGKVGVVRSTEDALEVSRGLSGQAWKLVHWLYRHGASPGPVSRLYGLLRSSNDYNRDTLGLSMLGRSLRKQFLDRPQPLVVSHPILVGLFRNRPQLYYQHGELVAPPESMVSGAELVFVPTDEVAEKFLAGGYNQSAVYVSGLCIEPALVKQASDAFSLRKTRLASSEPLTGAFYSSGAEPALHVEAIVNGALSLSRGETRAIIFAEEGRKLSSRLQRAFAQAEIPLGRISAADSIPAELPRLLLVEYRSRREEAVLTARLFPSFDFFVAPAHERSHWAAGLGLPMFILEPCIGPFAPLNRELLLRHKVAFDLTSHEHVISLSERVNSLWHRGELAHMAENGWGKYRIDGFAQIADLLHRRCTE